jgi:hypothetical protein
VTPPSAEAPSPETVAPAVDMAATEATSPAADAPRESVPESDTENASESASSPEALAEPAAAPVEMRTEMRRVNWTIVKRTLADLVTRKPTSTLYVLKRDDGSEAEFPTLSTARESVHKTIVHPEKLTLSKAEHAAAKGGGGKGTVTKK